MKRRIRVCHTRIAWDLAGLVYTCRMSLAPASLLTFVLVLVMALVYTNVKIVYLYHYHEIRPLLLSGLIQQMTNWYFLIFPQKTGFEFFSRLKKQLNVVWIKTVKLNSFGDILVIFSYFPKKTWFDFSCKLSLLETVCIKICHILFSGENKKNISVCYLLKIFITKTCLFKYTENFATKIWTFSDKKFW